MNNLGSLIQILVFVLVIAGPTIGAIAKKAKAHADAKRQEAEQNKRRIESIRTGRTVQEERLVRTSQGVPQGMDQSRRSRLEELARQRQAQIEELRRRAAARRQAQGGGGSTQTQPLPQQVPQQGRSPQVRSQPSGPAGRSSAQSRTPRQGPTTRPAPVPMPQQQRTARATAEANRRAEIAKRQAEVRARRQQAERARQEAERRAAAEQQSSRRVRRVEEMPVPQDEGAAGPLPGIAQSLRDPEAVRRAIVINEVLGPPVGLRGPGDQF